MTDTRQAGGTNQTGAPVKKRGVRGPLGCLLAVVVLVGICVAGRFLPGGSFPILIAIGVTGFLLLMRGILAGRSTNAVGLVLMLAGAVGACLLFYPAARLGGIVLLALAVGLLPSFFVELVHHGVANSRESAERRRRNGPLSPVSRVVAGLVGVSLGLLVVGQVGGVLRQDGGYYKRYGVPVQAEATGQCRIVLGGLGGMRYDVHYNACDRATWQLPDGTTATGTLKSDSIDAFNWGDHHVPAYAIGDTAYAARLAPDYGPAVVLGKLPSGALSTPFPIALVLWIVYGLVRRRTRPRPAG